MVSIPLGLRAMISNHYVRCYDVFECRCRDHLLRILLVHGNCFFQRLVEVANDPSSQVPQFDLIFFRCIFHCRFVL
jgi:hypothetical protein